MDSIPTDLDEIFDYTLTKDLTGDFNIDGEKLTRNDSVVGFRFLIDGHKSHENVRDKIGLVEWILLDFSNWKMIPVENMIAECEGTGTKIAVIVNLAKDVNGIAFALEKGVDAIVIKNDNDLIQACSIAKSQRLENSTLDIIQTNEALEKLTLSELTITNIQSGGIGERYCIDLICLI